MLVFVYKLAEQIQAIASVIRFSTSNCANAFFMTTNALFTSIAIGTYSVAVSSKVGFVISEPGSVYPNESKCEDRVIPVSCRACDIYKQNLLCILSC